MHSNSGLFNQRRPSCKGQRLKMKGRWFSFKDLSRASSPRNFLVFISMEEKERASNPWDVSVQEESSHKIPKSKGARQVYQSSVCSWSGGRKDYTELTGVEKSTLGLCYGNRDSLGLVTAHVKKKFLVERRESCKDKQEHGSSQNDKAKETLGFQPPTQKAAELNPIYKVLVDLFFVNIPGKKGIKNGNTSQKCRPHQRRSVNHGKKAGKKTLNSWFTTCKWTLKDVTWFSVCSLQAS